MKYKGSNPLPSLLKHFRLKSGLTQAEIADELAISRSGYANYEEGRTLPNIEQTIKLSELLDHDLLYAYTLSSRYMKNNASASGEMVMESGNYLASIESGQNTARLLDNYKNLDTNDKKLVEGFVEALTKKYRSE